MLCIVPLHNGKGNMDELYNYWGITYCVCQAKYMEKY